MNIPFWANPHHFGLNSNANVLSRPPALHVSPWRDVPYRSRHGEWGPGARPLRRAPVLM
jgi:hypothetical protein